MTDGVFYPPGGASAVDVTDRALRQLGIVSITGQPIVVDGSGVIQPISAASLPLPTGAATEATLAAVSGKLPSVLVGDRLKVDGSGVTQPVSITGTADVSDRAGRLVGIVDTELPAAAALSDTLGNPTTPQIGANNLLWDNVASQWVRARQINSAGDAVAATGYPGAGLYVLNPAGTFDRAKGDATAGQRVAPMHVTNTITVAGAANAIATATLPAAGAGLFHYITHIFIARVATALLAGGALLTVTTTNLGGRSWRTGNQASITVSTFSPAILTDQEYTHPIRSAVANTVTTIVGPAAGAAVSWHIVVDYYIAP